MPSDQSAKKTSTSGITTTVEGERHIPPSKRADGSLRREIRVRPGYRPPEDIEVYKNRISPSSKVHGQKAVPGAVFLNDQYQTHFTKSDGKPQQCSSTSPSQTIDAGNVHNDSDLVDNAVQQHLAVDLEAEKEKQAKKLTKRLRQARDLQHKKDKGDALLPEQFEKVIRIQELIRQLDNLGFNAEGHQKA